MIWQFIKDVRVRLEGSDDDIILHKEVFDVVAESEHEALARLPGLAKAVVQGEFDKPITAFEFIADR